jgi:glycosyltransferase involved in cell wall biosynthesis
VGDAELKSLYARCAAVFYAPFDEDYGLVTLEAFHCRKPVVTTTDAGGPLEFVRDGETGLVTSPDPAAIGAALARLLADPALARGLGDRGYESVRRLSWDVVLETLMPA